VQPITREELIPGDLVFSGRSGAGVQHVALYIGEGKVIHATNAGASRANQVRIDELDNSWVMAHKSYGRVVQ
ncbi:MAG: NlpC/P60 family, partial [Actinomycetota bacterium]